MSEDMKTPETPAAETEQTGQAEQATQQPAPKRGRKKLAIVGIVVVVIAAIGVGFWVWHETPGFCGTMCHESMNAYVATYEQAANSTGADKYGNAVSNTDAMLAVSHKGHNLACLSCHVPSLSQQLGEVQETLTGDYYVVNRADGNGVALREVGDEELIVNAGGKSGVGDTFCLRSGCHVTASGEVYTRETLTELTSDMEFNPHNWKHGQIECSDCHKSHRASVFYCTRCHYDALGSVPDGWVTFEEGQQILESTLLS